VLLVPASTNSARLGRQNTSGDFDVFLAEQAMFVRVDRLSFGLVSVCFSALRSVSFEISLLSGNREVLNECLVEMVNMKEKPNVELTLVPGANFMV